jgi:hypothetical protein
MPKAVKVQEKTFHGAGEEKGSVKKTKTAEVICGSRGRFSTN